MNGRSGRLGHPAAQPFPPLTSGASVCLPPGAAPPSARTQMAHFYEYFAQLRATTDTESVVWVEPYEDSTGAGRVRARNAAPMFTHMLTPVAEAV